MTPNRVIACGSQGYTNTAAVNSALDWVLKLFGGALILVHGACPNGGDELADRWGRSRADQVTIERHPADWERHGKRQAGMIRNHHMAKLGARFYVAFWDGKSPGTRNMIERATQYQIPGFTVPPSGFIWRMQ